MFKEEENNAISFSLSRRIWAMIPILGFMCILPLFLSHNWVSIVTEMMILALAGTALNLIFGYSGIVSFGHAGFFAVGAYVFGLLLYYKVASYTLSFILGLVAATAFGVIVGWFAIRLISHYLALFVLAASMVIFVLVSVLYDITGGDDGLIGIPVPDFFFRITYSYYFVLGVVVICLFLMYLITQSAFGRSLQAIRENSQRAEFIGINVRRHRYIAFIFSASFTGIAGILMASFLQCAFPGYADFVKSGELLFVCLLGGIYSFLGPAVGACLYIFLDKLITQYTEYWPLVLGCLIIIIALFFRGGIVGFIEEKYRAHKNKRGV